jgi:GNAT superfamily N-acetyltransferase
MDYELAEASATEGIPERVRAGIRAADPPDVGLRDWRPVTLALRTPEGALVGGLYGATMWGWLEIDGLWVVLEARGRGCGRRLVHAAEAVARQRGCRGVRLGTFDFQARAFYERLGYVVFGELPGFPAGHTHYELWKALPPEAPSNDGSTTGSP